MAGLEAAVQSLNRVRQEGRRYADQERYRKRRRLEDENSEYATPYVRRCCVFVYVLDSYNAQAAAEYLKSCRASRGAHEFPTEQLQNTILGWFAEWPVDELDVFFEPTTPQDKRIYETARRYCDDRHLHTWVADQNTSRGLAPRTSALADKYDEIRALRRGGSGEPCDILRSDTGAGKNRTFFTRWRHRMKVKMANLQPSGHMEEIEKQTKVPIEPLNSKFVGGGDWCSCLCREYRVGFDLISQTGQASLAGVLRPPARPPGSTFRGSSSGPVFGAPF